MKNFSPTRLASNAQSCFLVVFLVLAGQAVGLAQLGNDNPTGTSGTFNGNVTTAGSYDPYTGNATRSVTDLAVAGSVGAYPLAFTRTMNSRYTPGAALLEFGQAGNWRHSYQWSIDTMTISSYTANRWTVMPSSYSVNYPDGRRIVFGSGSPYFRAYGISDRFQQVSNPSGSDCYLLMADGGKVWFQAEIDRVENEDPVSGRLTVTSTFTFNFMGLIDPYGQVTTITYPSDGSMTVTEPSGQRYLKLFYITTPWGGDTVLDHVSASDGRSVKYNYGGYTTSSGTVYTYLGNVVYFGDSNTVAIYSYQNDNVDPNGRPVLQWAIDCMYGGPMWAIAYTFVPGASGGVYGQLQSENYLDPSTGNPGQAVSSLSINGNSRTETRGDGPSRTFNYNGAWLTSYTDFKGQASSIAYDANGYTASLTDARANTTGTTRESIIGALTVLSHPGDNSTMSLGYSDNANPYYVVSRTDERTNTTWFTRNTQHQIERIDYPNGAYETFAYNGFGQPYSHGMTSGGTETFYLDGRGMMWASSNPDGTTYYYYDGLDRLEHVTDARSNTTWLQYNARGQLTRITHMDGSYVQYGYDNHGDLISATDELGHTTNSTYDDYKRVLTVTTPVGHTTTYCYALDWVNPLLHTTNRLKYVLSPMSKNIVFDYDDNLRRIDQVAALNTPDEAWTLFEYDAVGNLTKITDPLGHATTFGYDSRNRRTSVTDALGYVTSTNYDTIGNKTWIKHVTGTSAETIIQFPDYDSMNRLTRQIDERGVTTTMGYDLSGNLIWNNDGNGNHYSYEYDALNRRKKLIFPDNSTEEETYDTAGNRATHKNRVGNIQTFFYDNRNRQFGFDWNDGFTPQVRITYDAASRPRPRSGTGTLRSTIPFLMTILSPASRKRRAIAATTLLARLVTPTMRTGIVGP